MRAIPNDVFGLASIAVAMHGTLESQWQTFWEQSARNSRSAGLCAGRLGLSADLSSGMCCVRVTC